MRVNIVRAKMDRFEGRALNRFDAAIAVSPRDADHFTARYGVDRVFPIPTAVNLEHFTYGPDGRPSADQAPQRPKLVFTGSMDWLANQDGIEFFMDDVWPIIATTRPDVSVTIVGRNPPGSLIEKAKRRNLPWTFTGFVDDVRPYVHEAQVYIIPLRVGGGTRLKVYEAMAMGCPMVSTTIGVEGLPVQPGQHFLLADTPQAFAQAILRLVDEPEAGRDLAESARHYVEENFSSDRVARVFEEICCGVIGRRSLTHPVLDGVPV